MTSRTRLRAVIAILATGTATLATVALGGGVAQAAATPLPAHVFAPYFESYTTDNPVTLAQQSGDNYQSFAFIQTATAGSCTAFWDGSTTEPLTKANFGSDISALQAAGGNAIPSFGGFTADTTGTDIADSCTSVSGIAKVYEKVFATYSVPRIDLDVEQNSLTDTAAITRRDQAIAMTEAWGKRTGHTVSFSYTMPVTTLGLTAPEEAILQDAKTQGAKIAVVNIMTFDYFDGATHEMATDTKTAARATHTFLRTTFGLSSAEAWNMLGVTEMPGIDDFGAAETFTQADAATVLSFAKRHGLGLLSFWAIERDNGGCPGTQGAGSCSGISQPTWFFSHIFQPFTG